MTYMSVLRGPSTEDARKAGQAGTVRGRALILMAALVVVATAACAQAGSIRETIVLVADDLVAEQDMLGSWGEFGFTGEPVAGLVHAYQLTGTAGYKTVAEDGGNYCLYDEGGYNNSTGKYTDGLFASGAYALTLLSEVSGSPSSNSWRTAVDDFYEYVARDVADTQDYIDHYLANAEDTSAVYDIARHTVAAFYVDADDKAIWRTGLTTALADVDDGDASPVMALGVAVWGLAKTGAMNGTPVDSGAAPGSLWDGVTLGNLPEMLADEQAPDGSFYTRFDHNQGYGFTEVTAIGGLGLIAADENASGLGYSAQRVDVGEVLIPGVDTGGEVYWKIGDDGHPQYYFLAGETLAVLPGTAMPGDANYDSAVDGLDYVIWSNHYGQTGNWADANFNSDLVVDGLDYVIWSNNYGYVYPHLGGSVPEPACVAVLVIGAALIQRRRGGPTR